MPELPEVETIVRDLRAPCVRRTIKFVSVRWKRHIAKPSAAKFAGRIRGQTITGIHRRGKYLVFELSADKLLIHLKMSGGLSVVSSGAPADKHAHTVFHFENGAELRFSDPRKFGRIYLVKNSDEVTGGLGPEPLDSSFTARHLFEILTNRRRQLKPLLLDQAIIAGIGNIYADESLHRAKLHPLRLSDSITLAEARGLWRSIRNTLTAAIRHNGSSIDWMYRGGGHQYHFRAYGRAGQPCPVCTEAIRRILVGQRSTHFCPNCQKL